VGKERLSGSVGPAHRFPFGLRGTEKDVVYRLNKAPCPSTMRENAVRI
jgi:hypothetical protein